MFAEELTNIVPKHTEELGSGHHGAHQGPGIVFISREGPGGCTETISKQAEAGHENVGYDCRAVGCQEMDAFGDSFIIWRPGIGRQTKSQDYAKTGLKTQMFI